MAYTGVVTAGLPYLLFSLALRHITPATGVTLALVEPVVAFALAVLVLGERPSPMAYLGLLLVVCGVVWVVWQELRGHRQLAHPGGQRDRESAREGAGRPGASLHPAEVARTNRS